MGAGAAALRQRLADAAHRASLAGTRQLRRFFAARQFDVVHIHAPYNPSFFMLAPFVAPRGTVGVGTYHSVFTPGRVRDLVHAPTRASLEPAARPHRRLGRLHRAARPLLPRVRLARHPERHRRGSLRARAPSRSPRCARAATRSSSSSAASTRATASGSCSRPSAGSGARATAARACASSATARCAATTSRRLAPEVAAAVHWAGRIDWNRPRYYASADVFCTPCQRASFGMVLLEAMSCGRPVVGSLISGFERLMTSGREGCSSRRTTMPSAFAAALGHLLDSPAELQRMGARGTRHRDHALLVESAWPPSSRRTTRSCAASSRARSAASAGADATRHEAPCTRLTRCRAWTRRLQLGCLRSPGWRSIFAFSSMHGGGHLPESEVLLRKLGHVAGYFVLTLLLLRALRRSGVGRRGARRDGGCVRLRGQRRVAPVVRARSGRDPERRRDRRHRHRARRARRYPHARARASRHDRRDRLRRARDRPRRRCDLAARARAPIAPLRLDPRARRRRRTRTRVLRRGARGLGGRGRELVATRAGALLRRPRPRASAGGIRARPRCSRRCAPTAFGSPPTARARARPRPRRSGSSGSTGDSTRSCWSPPATATPACLEALGVSEGRHVSSREELAELRQ